MEWHGDKQLISGRTVGGIKVVYILTREGIKQHLTTPRRAAADMEYDEAPANVMHVDFVNWNAVKHCGVGVWLAAALGRELGG